MTLKQKAAFKNGGVSSNKCKQDDLNRFYLCDF